MLGNTPIDAMSQHGEVGNLQRGSCVAWRRGVGGLRSWMGSAAAWFAIDKWRVQTTTLPRAQRQESDRKVKRSGCRLTDGKHAGFGAATGLEA